MDRCRLRAAWLGKELAARPKVQEALKAEGLQ
jgi:hypothetical protein